MAATKWGNVTVLDLRHSYTFQRWEEKPIHFSYEVFVTTLNFSVGCFEMTLHFSLGVWLWDASMFFSGRRGVLWSPWQTSRCPYVFLYWALRTQYVYLGGFKILVHSWEYVCVCVWGGNPSPKNRLKKFNFLAFLIKTTKLFWTIRSKCFSYIEINNTKIYKI